MTGTMNLFYAVWDHSERLLVHRDYPSCCENLYISMPSVEPKGELSLAVL